MEQITETIMQLISSEVCGNTLCSLPETPFSEKFLIDLLLLSRKHNVAHIVASALLNNGFLESSPQQGLFLNELYTAVYSQEKMNSVYIEICSLFEKNKIPYIPLKGAVIRGLYPQPWMRTSCDIDILVKEKDLESAICAIENLSCYSIKGESKHDVVIESSEGICVELHYKLLGNKKSPLYTKFLSKVWDSAKPVANSGYQYKLSDEVFYYYHVLHMAKHFRIGGCGLRAFLDLFLIEKNFNFNTSELEKMLKKGKLLQFAHNAQKLSKVWFLGSKHDEITLQMQEFVLDGGTFGSEKTRIISNQQRAGGTIKYILSRVFVPYDYIKRDYPILKKYPILTPFCEICRLFSLLFGKKKRFKESYIGNLNNISASQQNDSNQLFDKLGLK